MRPKSKQRPSRSTKPTQLQKKSKKAAKRVSKTAKQHHLGSKAAYKAPPQPLPGSKAFGALQKEWYIKLKQSGFNDLERFDQYGNALSDINGQSLRSIANYYCPIRERFYMRLRNYITHNRNWTNDALLRLVSHLASEGVPYRAIMKVAKEKGFTKRISIFSVHRMVKRFEKAALAWNKRHPEGLDFEPDVGASGGLQVGQTSPTKKTV